LSDTCKSFNRPKPPTKGGAHRRGFCPRLLSDALSLASYDHSGATPQAALRSSAASIFGVVKAWAVAIIVAGGILPLSASLATAITAGIASFLIVLASAGRILSVVPATFYGFASMFAYLSLGPRAFTISAMTSFSWENAIVAVPTSLVIGTGLGLTHGWLAYLLAGGGRHTTEAASP
jgi:hypothetical protein